MKECNTCHAKKGVKKTCETCHQEWREDKKPDNHNLIWNKVHGSYAVDMFETKCDYCHSHKGFCQDCHMSSPPPSHTLFFKNRGHGFWAETERMQCQPCHQQDFCMECHGPDSEVIPRSHTRAFVGNRPYLHCTNCHFPTGSLYGCNTCHNAEIIQMKHREATEDKADPIPEFVLEFSRNCLNACHPFRDKPFKHPIGALNNNDCLRCHSP
jgi:hypothetical protein